MTAFDRVIFLYLHAWAGVSPVLDTLVRFSAAYLVYAMALVIAVWGGYAYFFGGDDDKANVRRLFFLAAVGTFVSRIVIAEPLRVFFARARPYETLPLAHQLIEHAMGRSFPSGHATVAFAIAAAVCAYHRTAGAVLFLGAVAVGAARIIAGVHWPSDIVGGTVIGIAGVWIAQKIMSRFPGFFIGRQ